MDKMQKNKQIMIVGVIVILVVVAGFFLTRKSGMSNDIAQQPQDVLPEEQAIPTVDASVQVELTADRLKREVTLSVTGIPSGTENIEYEMSYIADGNLPKGVIGAIEVGGKTSIEKDGITLGTCSSGACVYDKGVKSVQVNLKFTGDYGAKVFEKEFEI